MTSPSSDECAPGHAITAKNAGTGSQPLHTGHGNQVVNAGLGTIHYHSSHPVQVKDACSITEWLNSQASPRNGPYMQEFHRRLSKRRMTNIGTWILDSSDFKKWKSARHPSGQVTEQYRGSSASPEILWMHGTLGVGKSMLASLIIDQLQRQVGDHKACIFFYFTKEDAEVSPANIIACFVWQLVQQLMRREKDAQVVESLRSAHNQYQDRETNAGDALSDIEWLMLLHEQAGIFEEIYLIIDALDNHADASEKQLALLEFVLKLPPIVKILITTTSASAVNQQLRGKSRHVIDLAFQKHDINGDIKEYVGYRIDQDENLGRLMNMGCQRDRKFRSEVINRIARGVKGIFLLAELRLNKLSEQRSLGDFENALDQPHEKTDHLFKNAIQCIREQLSELDREFALHILACLVHTTRPIMARAILHSFSFKRSPKSQASDRKFDREEEDIVAVCHGLTAMDPESKEIRLVHDSAKDILQRTDLLSSSTAITKLCLEYLLSEDFSQVASCPDELQTRCRKFGFLEYAAQTWEMIIRQEARECVDDVQKQAMILLKNPANLTSWFQVIVKHVSSTITGLHATVYFNAPSWLEKLLQEGMDANETCSKGQTALHWAAREGLNSLVGTLLRQAAVVSIQDNNADTPLHMAYMAAKESRDRYKYERTIRQLVISDPTQMNVRNRGDLSPFERAVNGTQHWITHIFAKHQPTTDIIGDATIWSPLRLVMTFVPLKEQPSIVRVLLEGGSDVKKPTQGCLWHPLIAASRDGKEDIVRMLLEYGALPDIEDGQNDTPLQAAILYGHHWIAQQLIVHGADVTRRIMGGSTLLIEAVKRGRDTIAVLLLGNKGCIDDQDHNGSTALHYAIRLGQRSISWLLVTNGASSTVRDDEGLTALDLTALEGDASLTWLLLNQITERHGKQADEVSTAWFHAVTKAHQDVIQVFGIQDPHLCADARDKDGLTALHHTVRNEFRKECVMTRALLKAKVNPDIPDRHERTALMLAAELGKNEQVYFLLENGADPRLRDMIGRTAKDFAIERNHDTVVNLLDSYLKRVPSQ